MPATTTTTVTIGSILDLIGPTTQPTASNDSQSAFDSLLQATKSPAQAPPDPSTPPSNSRTSLTTHPRSRDRNQQPAANKSAASDDPATSPSYGHDSPQSVPTTDPAATGNANGTAEHENSDQSDNQTDDPLASQQVVAQSLAGLPTAPQNTSPPDAPAPPDSAATTEDTANLAPAKAPPPTGNSSSTTQINAAQAGVTPQANSITSAEAPKTVSDQLNPIDPAAADESKAQHAAAQALTVNKVQPIKKADEERGTTDDSQPTVDVKLTPDPQPQPVQSKPHDQSPGIDALQSTPDASASATPGGDSASAQTANATPLVAPVVNLNPASQTTVASQSANSNATAAISNAPSRTRLPAGSLAPAAKSASRPASAEVDSTRLISRVVRAFSAAHERDGEVHLRLSPPELGSLRLDVRVENGTLTAHVQTETDAARTAIIDNLPALRDRLAEQGVRIDRFDVDLMQRQPGGMPDQPGGRQSDMPEAPLRFAPPTRSTPATAPITTSSSPSVGNSSGLNVVI